MNLAQMTRRSSPTGIALPSLSPTEFENKIILIFSKMLNRKEYSRGKKTRKQRLVLHGRRVFKLLFQSDSAIRQPFKVLPTNAPRILEIATFFKRRYSIIKCCRQLMVNEERASISISKGISLPAIVTICGYYEETSNSMYSGVRSKDSGRMRSQLELEFGSK